MAQGGLPPLERHFLLELRGNNPTRQGGVARRYDYGSIDRVQGHLNDDFFHLTAFIDVENPPSGSIDFDEFQLVYRNESLLFPDNGGRLASWPQPGADDPATLTDGWRHGAGRMWKSSPDRKRRRSSYTASNGP